MLVRPLFCALLLVTLLGPVFARGGGSRSWNLPPVDAYWIKQPVVPLEKFVHAHQVDLPFNPTGTLTAIQAGMSAEGPLWLEVRANCPSSSGSPRYTYDLTLSRAKEPEARHPGNTITCKVESTSGIQGRPKRLLLRSSETVSYSRSTLFTHWEIVLDDQGSIAQITAKRGETAEIGFWQQVRNDYTLHTTNRMEIVGTFGAAPIQQP